MQIFSGIGMVWHFHTSTIHVGSISPVVHTSTTSFVCICIKNTLSIVSTYFFMNVANRVWHCNSKNRHYHYITIIAGKPSIPIIPRTPSSPTFVMRAIRITPFPGLNRIHEIFLIRGRTVGLAAASLMTISYFRQFWQIPIQQLL